MPFFKTASKLVYYAHVPKCGGSSIATYIVERFGNIAFNQSHYTRKSEVARWTRSSPQHVDAATLEGLIPLVFFDAAFAVVRHPVSRAISTFHFQLELERTIPPGTLFSDWLAGLRPNDPDAPFAYDNHTRPMTDIVPPGATVFHLEHGIDALVPWFDHVSGNAHGPRAILPENARGAYAAISGARAKPSTADIDRITRLYETDFVRFGYEPGSFVPKSPAPILSSEVMEARDREFARANHPLVVIGRKFRRHLRRL